MFYTLEQLEERYNQLPEAVKEAMYAVETADKIMAIGKKYNLHIDQIGLLAEETGLVMLGLTPYYQFMDNIQKKLGVNRAASENITLDINTEIFLPIREFLKQGGALPSREEVLRGVENPETIFEQKMAKMFNLPKETRQEQAREETPAEPKVIDPYIEPTD